MLKILFRVSIYIFLFSLILATAYFLENAKTSIEYINQHTPTLNTTSSQSSSQMTKTIPIRLVQKRSLNLTALTPEEIYQETGYVVKIKIFESVRIPLVGAVLFQYSGFGSGSVVRCKKFQYCILTANHVVDKNPAIFYAEFKNGSLPQKLELIKSTTTYDAAILRFSDSKFQPKKFAVIGNSALLQVGTPIISVGSNILGDFWSHTNGSLVTEIGPIHPNLGIKITDGVLAHPKLIITDTKVLKGYSGGPLLNKYGQLIGIAVGNISLDGDTLYVGTPINEIKTSWKL